MVDVISDTITAFDAVAAAEAYLASLPQFADEMGSAYGTCMAVGVAATVDGPAVEVACSAAGAGTAIVLGVLAMGAVVIISWGNTPRNPDPIIDNLPPTATATPTPGTRTQPISTPSPVTTVAPAPAPTATCVPTLTATPTVEINIDTSAAISVTSGDPVYGAIARTQFATHVAGKQIVMTATAQAEFHSLYPRFAGATEMALVTALLANVKSIADNPSQRVGNLPTSRRLKLNDKIIFGTGDNLGIMTIASETEFRDVARNHGVDLSSQIIIIQDATYIGV